MDQGMGGMPPPASTGYPQQRVPASAPTQYGGPTTGGYAQQQPQQQQYQQQAPGYGELLLCAVFIVSSRL